MSLPVAVLAGGLATRLQPVAGQIPKILIEVAGRPFAEHQIDWLRGQGVSHAVFCVGHLGEQIARTLGDGDRWGMTFQYVFDGPTLAGTGGALRGALPHLGPAFFVMYGDSYLQCDFRTIEAAFRASGQPGLMTVFRNDDQWDRSNVQYEDGRIIRYNKRQRSPDMRYIDYGLGVLTPQAFEPWTHDTAPFDLELVYQDLILRGRLAGYEVHERFYEIGSMAGLEETRALLRARQEGTA